MSGMGVATFAHYVGEMKMTVEMKWHRADKRLTRRQEQALSKLPDGWTIERWERYRHVPNRDRSVGWTGRYVVDVRHHALFLGQIFVVGKHFMDTVKKVLAYEKRNADRQNRFRILAEQAETAARLSAGDTCTDEAIKSGDL